MVESKVQHQKSLTNICGGLMTQIINYSETYQADFKRLNVEWISGLFAIEEHDIEQLDNPERYILKNNGAIFLAKVDEQIVGTVAMVNTENNSYELAKMCITPTIQGRGIGRLLCEKAIEFGKEQGAKLIWLESNRRAKTAIILYEKVGFVEVPMLPSPYARADIRMELVVE